MPEHTTRPDSRLHIPGLDPDATPLIGLGLSVAGLVLGIRPRLAPWPLALTAAAALLYRDPERATPNQRDALFAPADGVVREVDEIYEHRFLHTEALRISIAVSPIDVPVQRSPAAGQVSYMDYLEADQASGWETSDKIERGPCLLIGITTPWAPLLLAVRASALHRQIIGRVEVGQHVVAGQRLSVARFGARVSLLVPRDLLPDPPQVGDTLRAGVTRIGSGVPLG
ncbi:MAG TPA: phosphatidylserine decarboxylase [Roseiflexaceae bacterium]|nr:phosphatidylserine decarboxylase [Roseiflexaceae bacterium]